LPGSLPATQMGNSGRRRRKEHLALVGSRSRGVALSWTRKKVLIPGGGGCATPYRHGRHWTDSIPIFFNLSSGYRRTPSVAPFDFYRERFTIRLIQKICANAKIIMIYLKYI
jgi:hypothetical protein